MMHLPVLLNECIENLNIKPDGIYVDGTFGRGGHSGEIVKRLTSGKLIAIDRDAQAFCEARELINSCLGKIECIHGNFSDIQELLKKAGYRCVDGMLFDLGVSSPQLDTSERGFSYMQDAPLDMRMDTGEEQTAFNAVNTWSEETLKKVFYEFGEERYGGQIARAIVRKREREQITTTFELNSVIFSAIPSAARREAQHPSKRVFQALRIAVNDELGSISSMLEKAPEMLKDNGRICVISFHSLEDRIVKNSFLACTKGCICPRDFPICVCGFKPTLRVITKKPITPRQDELDANPRARSAKLRVAERV